MAGLENENLRFPVPDEACRGDAAGRAASDDDVVEPFHQLCPAVTL
jgi:hypothetical protein